VHLTRIDAVDQDTALGAASWTRCNKVDQRRLASARRADDCDRLAGGHVER
jgi:hypothetical protein